ncbi:MAG TPA: 50S ribosomal protein L5, partial [Gammaproteobacteria bacterium]|nr:50S ribosomal protein L5 [Gammaproteobacteria bacterium]
MQARLQQRYTEEIAPQLLKEFSYASPMQIPRLEKIIINMGLGEAARDRAVLDNALEELASISGQKPMVTRARKSVAGFKIRA